MGLSADFPRDPHVILDPAQRWFPGETDQTDKGLQTLLPPLVHRIRQGVKAWRDAGYAGASETSAALLRHWFQTEHLLPTATGDVRRFQYYFCQREAVETIIWLYEIERARDPYGLIKYDSHGYASQAMFSEDWTRYVIKMATGSGKTKVMSLLLAWAYFHKRYEPDSDLSTNFLVIAPNIIVLDRLYEDFQGLRIFFHDPVLPDNGYEGQNWRDDFQVTLHVQDQVGRISETGNIFLTNIHRVFENDKVPSFEDDNTMDYFLGKRPTGKTNDSRTDLGRIVREVPDLMVINDEAHHIHDEGLAWYKNIEDIRQRLRQKGREDFLQLDLTATPKHNNGAIFVQTVTDYPLVEAVRQGVVKTPVLPDAASRAKLQERVSDDFVERYEDYLRLGYLEWLKVYDELLPSGKKSVLFIMTDDTKNCDKVGEYLESRYPELKNAVLVIHTKNNGEISEASTGRDKDELDKLRKQSREIDLPESPFKAIVSVMMLREGWDVQNVVSIVGLRPFKAKSKILPEQALGRGLRRMFRGQDVTEKVSVIGTDAFIDFVEGVKAEGVELEYAEMGDNTKPKSPLVVEVDRNNPNKDIDRLDIDMPVLTERLHREYKNLHELDVTAVQAGNLPVKAFTEAEQREIVFKNLDNDQVSHTTVLDTTIAPNYHSVVGYFVQVIMRDLHLVSGADILFGKIKEYMQTRLFDTAVVLDDLNILRNMSEVKAVTTVLDGFKAAINALTVRDSGTTEIRNRIKFGKTRPVVVANQGYVIPKKSLFNKVIGDSHFELEFAAFLDDCKEIISFVKNSAKTSFRIEYQTPDGGIANYYPDFLVKETEADIWVIETKGQEDLHALAKLERLQSWCEDATARDQGRTYRPMYVKYDRWHEHRPKNFKELKAIFTSTTA